jgi:predicted TIM-barrel fold metal-dependent hydrolase
VGSDWPHRCIEGETPDAGRLFDLLCAWTPDAAGARGILVDHPARLYGCGPDRRELEVRAVD